jgi:hypothetical protein
VDKPCSLFLTVRLLALRIYHERSIQAGSNVKRCNVLLIRFMSVTLFQLLTSPRRIRRE